MNVDHYCPTIHHSRLTAHAIPPLKKNIF